MVKLFSGDPASSDEDMALEVDRVEDARTVTELFCIPAAHWRELLIEELRVEPGSVEDAYRTLPGFWDWLATSFATLPPEAPASPGPGWLCARYHDWQRDS